MAQAAHKIPKESFSSGTPMDWRKAVAHITGTVDAELLLRREYLSAENRILVQQLQGRAVPTQPTKMLMFLV